MLTDTNIIKLVDELNLATINITSKTQPTKDDRQRLQDVVTELLVRINTFYGDY